MTRLVVIEGPDAGGKSTQVSAVARQLRAGGVKADWWHHPRPDVADARSPWSLALFFAAARARLAAQLVAGQGPDVLIVDRWTWSTTTAQIAREGGPLPAVECLTQGEEHSLPVPALTVLLTASGDLLDKRLARRGEIRPQNATRLRAAYDDLAHAFGWPVVSTARERGEVTTELVRLIRERLALPAAPSAEVSL